MLPQIMATISYLICYPMKTFLFSFYNRALLIVSLLIFILGSGQTDDFNDGNFTANPVWSGNTTDFSVQTASPYLTGGAVTDGSYLASNANTGNVVLTTLSTEVNEWKFSFGSGDWNPSLTNYFGIILMSNNSGIITTTGWTGYFLKIGSGATNDSDKIELWKKNGGSGAGTKVGDFPSSPIVGGGQLKNGLNVRVTRSPSGVFELFYSTGYTYSSTPTTSAGTVTDTTITTSSYFGVYSVFANPSAARRVFIDNIALGNGPTVTTTSNAGFVGTTDAYLTGTINANNKSVASGFEYGTSASYGTSVTASPASVTGTTTTDVDAYINGLSVNTQYHYRAVGTVGGVPVNGSDMAFYTLANTPGVLVVDNPQLTTLDVTVNGTTQNSNPIVTTYAINETTTGNFVQADGTLGTTPAWQTAAVWGIKKVTGLANSTTYTFKIKARNGDLVETVYSTETGGTTLTPAEVDYNRIQFPTTTQYILEDGNFDVYIRAYEPGLTTKAGAQTSLQGWVGYSAANNDPTSGGWTWVKADFKGDFGDEDEYKATLSGLAPGKYYYAGRFQIDAGPFVYGGVGGNWNNDSVELNVEANVVNYANIQHPADAEITVCNTLTVYAQVYEPGATEAAGQGEGITAQIGYSTSNTTPNDSWTWVNATYNTTPLIPNNNDEYYADLGSGLAPGTYYYASRFKKTGSNTYQYGGTGGIWHNDSGVLAVNALGTPVTTAATNLSDDSFTAQWTAVADAEGYVLDVYSIQDGVSPNLLKNGDFETGNVVDWTFESSMNQSASTAEKHSGNYSLFSSVIATKNFSQTISVESGKEYVLGFWYYIDPTSTGNGFRIWTTTGATIQLPSSSTYYNTKGSWVYIEQLFTPSANSLVFNVRLYNGVKLYLDDISIRLKVNSLVPTPVAGSPFNISAPLVSYHVTGLTADIQYFYSVRSVNGSCTSPSSNVTEVFRQVIWNGSKWNNTTGPNESINAKIIGPFVTGIAPQNDFTAKKVTIDTGGSLHVTSGHTITVMNELINNLTADKVVIEDGANLLQVTDSPPVVNSGSVRVEKLFTFTTPAEPTPNRQQYNYVSSPVIGGNLKDIYPGSPAALYHNQATNTFFTSSGANIIGRALALKEPSVTAAPAQTVTAAFSGVPFNGTLNYPLAYTTANASVSPGFNLVGNPYPSNIDLELLYEANQSNIEASFWFWDNRGNTEFKQLGSAYTGDNYAKYNAVSGTGVGIGYKAPNSPDDALRQPNKFVKVGTGFMVRALTGRNGQNLIFNNTMRSADNSGPSFFGKESLKDRYWLNMKTPAAMEFSNAVVYFDGGNQAFGPEDTRTFNSSDGIYTVVDEYKLAINGKPKFEVTDKVNVGLNMFASGNYTISLRKKEGIFANGQNIYLKDKQAGTVTNLSEGSYTFTASAGETTGRFEIIYQPETVLGTDGSAKDEVKVYRDGQDFVINSPTKKITGVEVYDTSGKLILKSSTNQSEVRLDGSHWINGIYVLKIHRNGQITTKKVVK